MKKLLASSFLLLASCFLLISCNDTVNSIEGSDNTQNNMVEGNPYEWVGLYHNSILDHVIDNNDMPYYNGIWPDIDFIDTTLGLVQSSINILYPLAPQSIDIVSQNYINSMNIPTQLLSNFRTDISNSINLSSKDKSYALLVLDLSQEIQDSLYDFSTSLEKIQYLENNILNESWDLNTEGLALFSISIYKNSYIYWNSVYGDEPMMKSKDNSLTAPKKKEINRGRVAANGCADYVVGAGTFLAATGASGGLGAGAGLWAGVKAGVTASTVVDWAGSLLGWW